MQMAANQRQAVFGWLMIPSKSTEAIPANASAMFTHSPTCTHCPGERQVLHGMQHTQVAGAEQVRGSTRGAEAGCIGPDEDPKSSGPRAHRQWLIEQNGHNSSDSEKAVFGIIVARDELLRQHACVTHRTSKRLRCELKVGRKVPEVALHE